jgi:hypothetical protein
LQESLEAVQKTAATILRSIAPEPVTQNAPVLETISDLQAATA